jgi:hypothetical protein
MSGTKQRFDRKSKIFIGGSTLAVIIILYFAAFYPWPVINADMSGTIGGVEKVKKYQKEQINSGDVAVETGDIQQLLQNDKIQTLINDPNFRTAVDNENFRREFNRNFAFRQAITRSAVYRTVMSNRNWVEALRNDAFRSVVESGAFAKIAADASLQMALRNASLRTQLAGSNYSMALRNEALRQISKDASFTEAMRDASFRQLLTSSAMRQMLSDRQFTEAFRTDAARTIFSDAAFQMALRQEMFRNAATSESFMRAIQSDALAKYWDHSDFRTEVFRTEAERNIEAQRNMDAQRNIQAQRSIEAGRTNSK